MRRLDLHHASCGVGREHCGAHLVRVRGRVRDRGRVRVRVRIRVRIRVGVEHGGAHLGHREI